MLLKIFTLRQRLQIAGCVLDSSSTGYPFLNVKSDFRMEETTLKQGSPDSHWSYLELDSSVTLFVTIALVKSCYL